MRFSGFDDEWKSYRIGDISKTYSGGTPSTSKKVYYYGNIPFIKSGEINKSCTEQYINEDAINNSSAKKVKKGDLLLALYGATSGEVAISKIDGAINQAVLKIDNNMDNYFQYNYFLKYKEKIIHKYLQGGQGNLSANIIKKLEFKFPKMEEQQKISRFLLLIDEKIQLLKKKHKEYQNFKKYLMQQIFTQKLRFNFNDAWKTVKIKDIFDERSEKGFLDLELLSVTLNDGVIKRSEIESKDNSNENKSNYKHVLPGDIVYNSMRMWQGASGVSPYEGIVSPAYTILIPKNVYSKYFGYYFKTNEMVYQFKKYSQGLTSDTWNLKYPLISEIKIKIPSIEEQKEITNVFEIMDEKIKILQNNIDELTTFKKGLLQQMFVVRINWRCNFKLAKSPSFNKHLLILKNKIIFIIIK